MTCNEIRKIWLPSLIVLVLIWTGCDLFPENSNDERSGASDQGVSIQFTEYIQADTPPELHFRISTNEIFGCYNYKINYVIDKISSRTHRLVISLTSIELHGNICATALGPATAMIPFEEYSTIEEIVLLDGRLQDRLSVNISDKKAEVEVLESSFTTVEHIRTYLTPENSFYTRCSTSHEAPELCNDWFQKLENDAALSEFKFPNDGIIPYPRTSPGANSEVRYYLYDTDSDFDRVLQEFEEFVLNYAADKENVSLFIQNWLRQSLSSSSLLN